MSTCPGYNSTIKPGVSYTELLSRAIDHLQNSGETNGKADRARLIIRAILGGEQYQIDKSLSTLPVNFLLFLARNLLVRYY